MGIYCDGKIDFLALHLIQPEIGNNIYKSETKVKINNSPSTEKKTALILVNLLFHTLCTFTHCSKQTDSKRNLDKRNKIQFKK